MDQLNILLDKNLIRIESFISDKKSTKIIDEQQLLLEVQMTIHQMSENNRPIEVFFSERKSRPSFLRNVVETIEMEVAYVMIEQHLNECILFCEKAGNSSAKERCYIRWGAKGIECIWIRAEEIQTVQIFSAPLKVKKFFKKLKPDEIRKVIGLFYGRSVEIEDLLQFQQVGDKAAIIFLEELSAVFLEILTELKESSQQQMYYVSTIFPLFRRTFFFEKLKQTAQDELSIKIN